MNTDNIQIEEDEIDIKEVFRTLYRYKTIIFILVVVFGFVSSYYAYFKPNVYQASASVEVGLDQRGGSQEDVLLAMTMDPGTMNADTKMEIIKSRFLTGKALKKVDFSYHYYTTRKFKEIELYKESPFEVGMLKGYDISFDITPADEKSYCLVVTEAKDKYGRKENSDTQS